MPATGWGSTTNEERLDLVLVEPAALSGRPRLFSRGTILWPARTGRHLQRCPAVVRGQYRAHRTLVEDPERSIEAHQEAYPAGVHRQFERQNGPAANCAQT